MSITVTPAGFWRRLFALIYDALLVVAILFIATAISTAVTYAFAPSYATDTVGLSHDLLHQIWLLLCWYIYFAISWKKSGQTIGMKAWRLRLLPQTGVTLTHKVLFIRFITAFCGVGLLLALFHSKKFSVQDIASNTQVVLLPKSAR